MSNLIHKDITGKIIKAYYNVYNGLTRGYAEFIYENAMMVELQQQNIRAHRQPEYDIYYKEWIVGKQRLDILAAQKIVIELKVKEKLDDLDKAQLISYLKTTGCQVGLLFNFGSLKPEFKWAYFTPKASQPPPLPPAQQIRLGIMANFYVPQLQLTFMNNH